TTSVRSGGKLVHKVPSDDQPTTLPAVASIQVRNTANRVIQACRMANVVGLRYVFMVTWTFVDFVYTSTEEPGARDQILQKNERKMKFGLVLTLGRVSPWAAHYEKICDPGLIGGPRQDAKRNATNTRKFARALEKSGGSFQLE